MTMKDAATKMTAAGMLFVGKITKATGKAWYFGTTATEAWAMDEDGVIEPQFKMTSHAMKFWHAMVDKNVAEGRWTVEMA